MENLRVMSVSEPIVVAEVDVDVVLFLSVVFVVHVDSFWLLLLEYIVQHEFEDLPSICIRLITRV